MPTKPASCRAARGVASVVRNRLRVLAVMLEKVVNTPMHVSIILFAIGLLDRNVAGMPLSLAPKAKAA